MASNKADPPPEETSAEGASADTGVTPADRRLLLDGEDLDARQMAMRRKQWRESPQHRRVTRAFRIISILLLVPIAIAIFAALAWQRSVPDKIPIAIKFLFLFIVAGVVYAYIAFYTYMWYRIQQRNQFRDDLQIGVA